ncbi:MAG: OB-fold domain-containing protein [Actinobacteria bacterium]|nr:OB-fold domain-containing protein [Actinomycetota bacterium]
MAVDVVDATLFASVDPVALRGSVCAACGAHVFPALESCPMCAGVDVADVALPTQGTVWSWTTQHFEPKAPFRTDGFAPFSIGYVDLGPVIVEGWLVGKTDWSIGEHVSLVLAKAWTDGDTVVHTFGFEVTA